MTTSPVTTSPANSPARGLALLVLLEAAMSFAPISVLGPAIGWPASLGHTAAQQLTAIAAKPDAVSLGYGLYLLYSVALAPLLIVLAAKLLGGLQRPLGVSVAVFAGLSTFARSIGILRWLTIAPVLASQYTHADLATQHQLEMLFTTVHRYGGGIGEILGVGLFMAMAMGALVLGAAKAGTLPKWVTGLGVIAVLAEIGLALPAFGLDIKVPPALATITLMFWMLGVAVSLFRSPRTKA